ncbi:MAG: putative antitoxin [Candidatus Methanocomedens sp.]|nr:MAG: putative antitoxin [ANME-2 cluster archaeon]
MPEMIALPATIEMEMKALVRDGHYANLNEAIKDAFRTLLNVRPELKTSAVIELYKEGEISIGKAAEMVGVSTIEFKDILVNRGIHREVGSRSKKELDEGVELINKLRK